MENSTVTMELVDTNSDDAIRYESIWFWKVELCTNYDGQCRRRRLRRSQTGF